MSNQIVLFTKEFEPIIILTLSKKALQYIKARPCVTLACVEPMKNFGVPEDHHEPRVFRCVTIYTDQIQGNGKSHDMLFTASSESADLLKAAFLQTPHAGLHEREPLRIAQGFLAAIKRLG